MKKIVILTLIVILSFSLIGCVKNFAMNMTMIEPKSDNLTNKTDNITFSFKPVAEHVYYLELRSIEMTVKNNSDDTIKIIWDESVFVMSDGTTTPIIPGKTKFIDVGKEINPSIIPAKAKKEEIVIPRSKISGTETEPILTFKQTNWQKLNNSKLTVLLTIEKGENKKQYSHKFNIQVKKTE